MKDTVTISKWLYYILIIYAIISINMMFLANKQPTIHIHFPESTEQIETFE